MLGMAKMRQSRVNIEYQVINAPYCSEGSIPLLVSLELKEKVCYENIVIHEFELIFIQAFLFQFEYTF